MSAAVKLYIVRHGQTEWNREKRMQGREDSPLTDEGIAQLRLLGRRLDSVDFCRVVTSPLGRAAASAAVIRPGEKAELDPAFTEMSLGRWEGRLYGGLDSDGSEMFRTFWETPHLFRAEYSGGESFGDVRKRAVAAVDRIVEKASGGGNVLVVSHTLVIKSLLFYFEKRGLERFWIDQVIKPASLTVMEFSGGRFVRTEICGSVSHYQQEETAGLI